LGKVTTKRGKNGGKLMGCGKWEGAENKQKIPVTYGEDETRIERSPARQGYIVAR
jgi:hypothetical protein